MPTALLYEPQMNLHDDPSHPERAARLAPLRELLEAAADPLWLRRLTPRAATEREIARVHQWRMMEHTQMMAYEGGGWLGADTYVTSDSWLAATLGAGAAIVATEAVMEGVVDNAFAVVRPPGHHATPTQAMGFCLVNHVAVAAQYALDHFAVQRVAIIDWDVHHGNGTQEIFYDNPQVLYCSTHNYPFYPGTGHWREWGKDGGYGTTLNVPLPPGTGDYAFLESYTDLIIPAIRRFDPDLILVSAGYDAHWADPLGAMHVSTTGYGRVAAEVYNLAAAVCDGRLVCVLEGGYNPAALAACIKTTVDILGAQPVLADDVFGQYETLPIAIDGLVRELRTHHPLL